MLSSCLWLEDSQVHVEWACRQASKVRFSLFPWKKILEVQMSASFCRNETFTTIVKSQVRPDCQNRELQSGIRILDGSAELRACAFRGGSTRKQKPQPSKWCLNFRFFSCMIPSVFWTYLPYGQRGFIWSCKSDTFLFVRNLVHRSCFTGEFPPSKRPEFTP